MKITVKVGNGKGLLDLSNAESGARDKPKKSHLNLVYSFLTVLFSDRPTETRFTFT